MLSKVLKKTTCAKCRFCCSFRRCSLWETPLFPSDVMNELEEKSGNKIFERKVYKTKDLNIEYGQMNLLHKYKTEDENEEVACEFLDNYKGCILNEEQKPFDCKIWPLRVMNKEGKIVIALTPTCPAINEVSLQDMKKLVEDGIGEKIYEYARQYPFIIKAYKEGFPILMEKN